MYDVKVEVRAEKEVAVRPYVKSLIVASGKDIQYCIRRRLVLQKMYSIHSNKCEIPQI
jgi:hypothetical protein